MVLNTTEGPTKAREQFESLAVDLVSRTFLVHHILADALQQQYQAGYQAGLEAAARVAEFEIKMGGNQEAVVAAIRKAEGQS